MIVEQYNLLSIVVHSGSSLHYGHYYTYLKTESSGIFEWYQANDSSVTKVSFENLISAQNTFKDDTPYIVFYQRMHENLENDREQINIRRHLIDMIEQNNKIFEAEERNRALARSKSAQVNTTDLHKNINYPKDDEDDAGSGGSSGYIQNEGPRSVF